MSESYEKLKIINQTTDYETLYVFDFNNVEKKLKIEWDIDIDDVKEILYVTIDMFHINGKKYRYNLELSGTTEHMIGETYLLHKAYYYKDFKFKIHYPEYMCTKIIQSESENTHIIYPE